MCSRSVYLTVYTLSQGYKYKIITYHRIGKYHLAYVTNKNFLIAFGLHLRIYCKFAPFYPFPYRNVLLSISLTFTLDRTSIIHIIKRINSLTMYSTIIQWQWQYKFIGIFVVTQYNHRLTYSMTSLVMWWHYSISHTTLSFLTNCYSLLHKQQRDINLLHLPFDIVANHHSNPPPTTISCVTLNQSRSQISINKKFYSWNRIFISSFHRNSTNWSHPIQFRIRSSRTLTSLGTRNFDKVKINQIFTSTFTFHVWYESISCRFLCRTLIQSGPFWNSTLVFPIHRTFVFSIHRTIIQWPYSAGFKSISLIIPTGLWWIFSDKVKTSHNLTLIAWRELILYRFPHIALRHIGPVWHKTMSEAPLNFISVEELENRLLDSDYSSLAELPTPSLEQSIYNISSDLNNLSVTIQSSTDSIEALTTTENFLQFENNFMTGNQQYHSDFIQSDNVASSFESADQTKASTPISPPRVIPSSIVTKPKRKLELSQGEVLNPTKRFKPVMNMFPFAAAAAAAEAYVVDILPDTQGEELFTDAQGKAIGNSIARALFSDANMATIRFESSGLDRGRYRLICSDAHTRDWAITTIPTLDGLWQGANLRAVVSGPPPNLVRATVVMQLPAPEPNDFFNIIATQNPTLDTSNWKLYSRSKSQNGRQQWVIGVVDTTIPALRDIIFRPYCGMTRIRIILNNANQP